MLQVDRLACFYTQKLLGDTRTRRAYSLATKWNMAQTTPSLLYTEVRRSAEHSDGENQIHLLAFYLIQCSLHGWPRTCALEILLWSNFPYSSLCSCIPLAALDASLRCWELALVKKIIHESKGKCWTLARINGIFHVCCSIQYNSHARTCSIFLVGASESHLAEAMCCFVKNLEIQNSRAPDSQWNLNTEHNPSVGTVPYDNDNRRPRVASSMPGVIMHPGWRRYG